MTHWRLFAVFAAFLAAMIGGSGLAFAAPEDKINAAIPVSEETLRAKAALVEHMSAEERKAVEDEFKVRIRARALTCAKGYAPSWFTSDDEIRQRLSDRGCFVDADAEIGRWLKLCRAGLILAKPPLRPIPARPPAYLSAEEPIHNVRFAEKAGIALLELKKTVQIVDLESGKIVYREAKTAPFPHPGFLSPNGRLYSWGGSDGRVKICESETGGLVAEIPWTYVQNFHWLDSRYALYSRYEEKRGAILVDFATGKEVQVAAVLGPVLRVVPVSVRQYVAVTSRAMVKFEIRDQGPETALIQERAHDKGFPAHTWTHETSGPTADGSRYFHGYGDLFITSLGSLEQVRIPFEPCNLTTAFATPDPDKILIGAFPTHVAGQRSRGLYLYSIGTGAVIPVDYTKIDTNRFVYVPSVKRLAAIKDATIALLSELPQTDPLPPSDRPGEAIRASIFAKMGPTEMRKGSVGPYPPSVHMEPTPAGPPLAELAKDATIEAVGVYEGWAPTPRTFRDHTPRHVEIRVRRSAQPIVLVLSSYEPVRWTITLEEGAKLAAVLVSGYNQSEVVGAGSARILTIGSAYAYKQDHSKYHALESEVFRYTGKRINLFQGKYTGKEFDVGG